EFRRVLFRSVFLAWRPGHQVGRIAALLDHLFVRDEHFGAVTVDAFDPGAEAFPLAAVEGEVDDLAQRLTDPAFGDLGPVLGPVGLDQACLRVVGDAIEALLLPEIDGLGEHRFRRTVYGQPAQPAVALDAHVGALRQDAGLAGAGRLLRSHTLLLVFREGRGAGFRGTVARIVGSLREVRRDAQRVAAARALVVDRVLVAEKFIDVAAG